MRAAKEQKIALPDIELDRRLGAVQDVAAQRENMKKQGVLPVMPTRLPVYMSCSATVFDDKIISSETEGLTSKVKDTTLKKGKSLLATRKIKKYEDTFHPKDFSTIAEDIYIKAHTALAGRRHKELHDYVTENCYPVMLNFFKI